MLRTPVAVLLLVAGTAAADDAAAKKYLKDLEGTYTVVSMTQAGTVASADQLKDVVAIVVKGDNLTIRFAKGDKGEDKAAILVVDSTQTPVAIDMTPKDGPDAGKPVLGIVKVEKDTVTLCWGDRSDKAVRPKEFSSTKENKHLLIVIKKK